MIENQVNLTITETDTHILTHVIEYDKYRAKNRKIVVKNRYKRQHSCHGFQSIN